MSIIKSKLSDDSFYNQDNNNLQGFTELAHVISKQKYSLTRVDLERLKSKITANISNKNSLTELSNATQVLGKNVKQNQIHTLITPERVSNELETEKIKLTDLETILTKNLKESDAVKIYTNLDREVLRKSCLRNDISFEQSTKVLMQLSNKESNYDKNKTYSKNILRALFSKNKSEFTRKIKTSNIQDFLTGYVRLYNIDSILTESNLLSLLKAKSHYKHKEATLSTASQSFKNIALLALKNKVYKNISIDFVRNSYNSLIENANGLDAGQISDGLKELSVEHSELAEKLLKDLFGLIRTKCMNEKDREDFKTRIIPQLLYSAGSNQKLKDDIKRIV